MLIHNKSFVLPIDRAEDLVTARVFDPWGNLAACSTWNSDFLDTALSRLEVRNSCPILASWYIDLMIMRPWLFRRLYSFWGFARLRFPSDFNCCFHSRAWLNNMQTCSRIVWRIPTPCLHHLQHLFVLLVCSDTFRAEPLGQDAECRHDWQLDLIVIFTRWKWLLALGIFAFPLRHLRRNASRASLPTMSTYIFARRVMVDLLMLLSPDRGLVSWSLITWNDLLLGEAGALDTSKV